MTYAGLDTAVSKDQPHLGGSIKAGDPFTFCPSVWDYVIARFCAASVLDLGSGSGNASNYFFSKGLRVVAVDGLPSNIQLSIYPAVRHDLTESPVYTRVDLVHCQEVVEHIGEAYLENVLDSMLSGRIILMTHALPGQGGHHHVNLQSSEYWISHLERKGCVLAHEDTRRIRALAAKDGAPYMSSSGMVFINTSRL